MKNENNILKWNRASWVWVFLCLIGIYSTIPVARSIQKVINDTVGREFFTYIVLFTVCTALAGGLYILIRKLEVRKTAQYLWLLACAGLYAFFTLQLKKYPEEAFHLVEYGLLALFLFNALSHKIRDRTIYFTTGLFVLFFGIADEALQWLMPGRVWGLRDVGINLIGGSIFILAVARGIRPSFINRGVTKFSVHILTSVTVMNLVLISFCLSNTPDMVMKYTSLSGALAWLRSEETMTEYGYKHIDQEIGTFYSRLTLEEMGRIDNDLGKFYGNTLHEKINPKSRIRELMNKYNLHSDKFLHEFLLHVIRRNNEFANFRKSRSDESRFKAFKENQILEKYFSNTLNHTREKWPDTYMDPPDNTDLLRSRNFISNTGTMITAFSLKQLWVCIAAALVLVWITCHVWKKKLSAC